MAVHQKTFSDDGNVCLESTTKKELLLWTRKKSKMALKQKILMSVTLCVIVS